MKKEEEERIVQDKINISVGENRRNLDLTVHLKVTKVICLMILKKWINLTK